MSGTWISDRFSSGESDGIPIRTGPADGVPPHTPTGPPLFLTPSSSFPSELSFTPKPPPPPGRPAAAQRNGFLLLPAQLLSPGIGGTAERRTATDTSGGGGGMTPRREGPVPSFAPLFTTARFHLAPRTPLPALGRPPPPLPDPQRRRRPLQERDEGASAHRRWSLTNGTRPDPSSWPTSVHSTA